MPIVDAKSVKDRVIATRSNVHPRLNGDLIAKPSNLFSNFAFADVDENGDPDGIEVTLPEQPDGFFVYLSEPNKGPDTLAAQNTVPIPLSRTSYIVKESWVPGHRPPAADFAAPIAPPLKPSVSGIASSNAGFLAGTWYVSFAYYDIEFRLTTMAPPTTVTITQGQSIVTTLPQDTPSGAEGLVIFLGSSPSNMFAQDYVSLSSSAFTTWTMSGPFFYGRTPPSFNETEEFPPRPPTLELTRGERPTDPITLMARSVSVAGTAESEPSDFTDPVTAVGSGTDSVAFRLAPGRNPRTEISQLISESTRSVTPSGGFEPNQQIFISNTSTDEESVAYDSSRGSKFRGLRPTEDLRTRGRTPEEAEDGESGVIEIGSPDSGFFIRIDIPGLQLPFVTGLATAALAAGVYWVGLTYSVRGTETKLSQLIQVTVSASQVLRVILPNPVNAILNPSLQERDSLHKPFDHTLNAGNASSAIAVATDTGEVFLDTNGTQTSLTTPSHSVTFPVNRSFLHRISADIDSVVAAGTQEAILEELDSGGSTLRTTTLKSVSSSGHDSYDLIYGPVSALGIFVAWLDGTVAARLTHRFAGGSRGGQMRISRMSATIGAGRPRLVEKPPARYRQPATTVAPKFTSYFPGGFKVLGPPPPTATISTGGSLPKLDFVDFESGSKPLAWNFVRTLTVGAPGTTDVVETPAAIDGTYGWHVAKTTTQTHYNYAYRDFGPSNRTSLAVRFKTRVRTMPLTYVYLCYITDPTSGFMVGAIYLNSDGNLYFQTVSQSPFTVFLDVTNTYLLGASFAGDVLDLELIVEQGNSSSGSINAGIGRNGGAKTYAGKKTGQNWFGRFPRRAIVGVGNAGDPSASYNFDFDSFTITDLGDRAPTTGAPPALSPYTLPDRPTRSSTGIGAEVTFESGSIPSDWSSSRTPSDGTTTAVVQGSSAISGSFGLRIADTGTAVAASIYIFSNTFVARSAVGVRNRFRIVARPNSGNITLLHLVSDIGQNLGRMYLDSTGDLYTQAYSAGTAQTAVKIGTGITNGTILTAELVGAGGGTQSGSLSSWYSKGGTGATSERQLWNQQFLLDWSAGLIASPRAGGMLQSVASQTFTLDLDSLQLTDQGEIQFIETTDAGVIINQEQYYLPVGSVPRDDLFLRGYFDAVMPGDQYVSAIRARYKGIATPATPCVFTAYLQDGTTQEIGSCFPEDGVMGEAAWADYVSEIMTIPTNCFRVGMHSRGIAEGEWVVQDFCFSPGTVPIREVSYPTTATITHTLDTRAASGGYISMERIWIDRGTIVEVPAGCTATTEFRSANVIGGPFEPPDWTTDVTQVPPNRMAQFRITFNTDTTNTPVLKSGTPFVEYGLMWAGAQVSSLTREDRSEFPGGVLVSQMDIPYAAAPHSILFLPSGRVKRERTGSPVGMIPFFILGIFTEDAALEIEETCLDKDFWVEARDKLYKVRFTNQVEFVAVEGSVDRLGLGWQMWAEAECGPVEILETASKVL